MVFEIFFFFSPFNHLTQLITLLYSNLNFVGNEIRTTGRGFRLMSRSIETWQDISTTTDVVSAVTVKL
jgi:hypothetical protein